MTHRFGIIIDRVFYIFNLLWLLGFDLRISSMHQSNIVELTSGFLGLSQPFHAGVTPLRRQNTALVE